MKSFGIRCDHYGCDCAIEVRGRDAQREPKHVMEALNAAALVLGWTFVPVSGSPDPEYREVFCQRHGVS